MFDSELILKQLDESLIETLLSRFNSKYSLPEFDETGELASIAKPKEEFTSANSKYPVQIIPQLEFETKYASKILANIKQIAESTGTPEVLLRGPTGKAVLSQLAHYTGPLAYFSRDTNYLYHDSGGITLNEEDKVNERGNGEVGIFGKLLRGVGNLLGMSTEITDPEAKDNSLKTEGLTRDSALGQAGQYQEFAKSSGLDQVFGDISARARELYPNANIPSTNFGSLDKTAHPTGMSFNPQNNSITVDPENLMGKSSDTVAFNFLREIAAAQPENKTADLTPDSQLAKTSKIDEQATRAFVQMGGDINTVAYDIQTETGDFNRAQNIKGTAALKSQELAYSQITQQRAVVSRKEDYLANMQLKEKKAKRKERKAFSKQRKDILDRATAAFTEKFQDIQTPSGLGQGKLGAKELMDLRKAAGKQTKEFKETVPKAQLSRKAQRKQQAKQQAESAQLMQALGYQPQSASQTNTALQQTTNKELASTSTSNTGVENMQDTSLEQRVQAIEDTLARYTTQ